MPGPELVRQLPEGHERRARMLSVLHQPANGHQALDAQTRQCQQVGQRTTQLLGNPRGRYAPVALN